MAAEFWIGDIKVGGGAPPVVIAEIGINHGGNLSTAKAQANLAIRGGADFIKTQTHIPLAEMSREAETRVPGNSDKSIFQVILENSLSLDEEAELASYIREQGGIYLSTPFSREAADFLEEIGVVAFKIGSGECNNFPLVEHIASKGKPVILSTGMNDIESVAVSADILRRNKINFALLHTTNLYPTPAKLIRLGSLAQLANNFPDAVVGLSDHSSSNAACLAAVALGAKIVERHFTDSKTRVGPDISCSMDMEELIDLKTMTLEIHSAMGGGKHILEEEDVTRSFAFSSVSAIKDIDAGDIYTRENIFPIRPAGGDFEPSDYPNLLGRRASRRVSARTQLAKDDIES